MVVLLLQILCFFIPHRVILAYAYSGQDTCSMQMQPVSLIQKSSHRSIILKALKTSFGHKHFEEALDMI